MYLINTLLLNPYNLFDLTSIKVYTTKGEYLCTAERVTETHPMAKLLGDVKDYEDYKQKIEKQRKLRRKTINSVKQYFSNEEVKFLETKIIEKKDENLIPVKMSFKNCLKGVQTLFKNNSEKYEYLIANDPSNSWITEFKNTKEYRLLYE